jgi:hypothetical protein
MFAKLILKIRVNRKIMGFNKWPQVDKYFRLINKEVFLNYCKFFSILKNKYSNLQALNLS